MNDATVSNLPTHFATTPSNGAATNLPAVTPGWKTSEFWMTAAGQVGLILAAAAGALPAKYAAVAGALGQVAYSLSRGMAKAPAAQS